MNYNWKLYTFWRGAGSLMVSGAENGIKELGL